MKTASIGFPGCLRPVMEAMTASPVAFAMAVWRAKMLSPVAATFSLTIRVASALSLAVGAVAMANQS